MTHRIGRWGRDGQDPVGAADRGEPRSRLAAIVESSTDAIVGTTLDGIVAIWNASAVAMFGYNAKEMIGREIAVLVPPDRAGELMPVHDRIRQGGRVDPYETKRLRKDGTVIDVSISISPIRDDNGAIVGTASVARDITERKRTEAERRASEDKLHRGERMETVSQLAGSIADEFSNLLGVIIGYAATVGDATADNPQIRDDVAQIEAAAGRAARLARELLVFSRRDPMRPEMVDLNAVLAGARDLLQTSIGADIELRLVTAPNLPTVMADRSQIEQVLLNLALNARDAMPDGGIVTFTTGLSDLSNADSVVWPGTRTDQYVVLSVSDTGCGMDAYTIYRCFDPFFTTKPSGRGVGLGLSALYGIVTKAGGGIAIESEEGTGTAFRVYLPAIYAAAPAEPPRLPSAARGPGQTILVVDDEPAVLEIIARILRHNGFQALQASTGDEALSLISAYEPELLLTSTVVPGTSGQALADRAREMRPGIRIVQMWGSATAVTGSDRVCDGQVPVIGKPFTAKDLLEKVRATLAALPGD